MFFVTHEARLPYGCRAFEMKTRVLPMIEVLRTSGAPCQAYVPRSPRPAHRERDR